VNRLPRVNDDASESSWPPLYGPLALLLALVLAQITGALILALSHNGGTDLNNVSSGINDAATVAQDLGFVAVPAYLAARFAPLARAQFGLRRGGSLRRSLALAVGAAVVFVGTSQAWFWAVNNNGSEKGLVKDLGGAGGTLEILGACLVVAVVAPICEELLFRGFIFRALRNWRGPWPAALITGLLFAAVHGLSAPAVDLLPLAVLGILLCLVYEWSGSLYPCIALHVLNNAIAFGTDENWQLRIVELAVASLAIVALVMALAPQIVRRLPQR
jgi:uncharacterized protein